ncbi:MAG: hypothetical protein LC687_04250 [Actinobacteria bacterium]|nr:hypothetical protein [Actinomycetota bacterium]
MNRAIKEKKKKRAKGNSGCKHSPEELRAASNHLYYEIWMLYSAAHRLPAATHGTVAHNALIESFAIHLRAVLDFLFPPQQAYESDVLAVDFVTPLPYDTRISELLDRLRERVHTEVAHLTYGRQEVSIEAKQWNLTEVLNAILPLARVFVDAVPSNLLGSRWQKDEHDLRLALASYSPSTSMVGGTTSTLVSTPGTTATYRSPSKSPD